jgi:hypothetical protein
MIAQLLGWLWLLPLDIPPQTPTAPVYPTQSHGFAAYIVVGLLALGVLVAFMVWISSKPRSRRSR